MSNRITAIKPLPEWQGKHGTMYCAELTLDDDRVGQVNMQKPDRWKVGDEVEIIHEQHTPNHGMKWRVQKPGFDSAPSSSSSSGGISNSDRNREINASWAINQVLEHSPVTMDNLDKARDYVLQKAEALLDIRNELITRLP